MITLTFLGAWALRSSILILSGIVLLKTLRVKDPSVRLAAWTAMLFASLAIPVLSVELPAMPVRTRAVALPPAASYRPAPAPTITVFQQEQPTVPAPKRFDWARAAVRAYLLVAGVLLLRLCLGLAMGWRLVRRSRPTDRGGVRESDRIASPATLGVLRPVIVLPADWHEWEAAKLAAVLAHERSHIKRRDPAVQVLSAIHRALLWYSPFSWYLDRQIVRLAEQASDDAAVAASRDRVSYAETLLEFMQRGVRRESWQGVPMARYGQPEQRIDRILDATALSRGVTRWSIAAILVLVLPLAYVVAAAQERLTFAAASVKPWAMSSPGGGEGAGRATKSAKSMPPDRVRPDYRPSGGPGTTDPGRIHYPRVTAQFLLMQAYGMNDYQIAGPDWLERQFFDMDATMAPGTTKEQFRKMLQNLLADRFQLAVHRETRELSGYTLVVAKNGPKLKESSEAPAQQDDGAPDPPLKPGPDGFFPPPPHPGVFFQVTGIPGTADARSTFRAVTMEGLAAALQSQLRRPVVDETRLASKYDFALNYSTQGLYLGSGPIPVSVGDGDPPHQPDLVGALQGQLGLKLEPKKVSADILVVDHMEKTPSGN